MSDKPGIEGSREYRFKEWLRFTKTRPYVCQPLLKGFYQCFDYYHFVKNQDEDSTKVKCLEKFNYEECLTENKDLCFENWIYNIEEEEEAS